MTELWFYHLEGARPETVLPDLLRKTLEKGWRAVVRAPDAAAAERIDAALWTVDEEGFLPHGRAGADDDVAARQPVWITSGGDAPNGADLLIAIDGAPLTSGEVADYRRAAVLFDAGDAAVREAARALWKAAKEGGASVAYWTRGAGGGWSRNG